MTNFKTGGNYDIEDNNLQPFYTTQVLDPSILAQIQGNPKGLRLLVDSQKRLWTPASMITSPQNPLNQFAEIATVQPFIQNTTPPQPGLVTHSYLFAFDNNGNQMQPIWTGYLDTTYGNPFCLATQDLVTYRRSSIITTGTKLGALEYQITSGTNAAQNTPWIDVRDLHSVIALYMLASGGTATVTVAVSNDNGSTSLTLDSVAAALSVTKNYTPTTPATTIALSPCAFQYIQITVGAAGAGNTTTLYLAIK